MGANLENLTLVGTAALSGSGNELGNTLTGNAGNNVLTRLSGFAGCEGIKWLIQHEVTPKGLHYTSVAAAAA